MHLCTQLAGMTPVESNAVRRAIGKKIPEDLAIWKDVFIEGASKKIPRKKAEELWKDLEAAANYSFNKSHAVAYSLLSYQTAWLKLHYPLEFITAALNNEGDKDEVVNYLIEAKRLGLKIVLPHVNSSEIGWSIQSDDSGRYIRMGLSNIKFISDKLAKRFIEHRPYSSYAELEEVVMTKGSGLNSRALQALRVVGGAAFEDNPRTGAEKDYYYEYLNLPAFNVDLPASMKLQFRTLDEYTEDEAFVCMGMVRGIKTGPGWARAEIVDETGTAGVFTNENSTIEPGQMYVMLVSMNRISRYISVNELMNDEGGNFQEFLESSTLDVPPDHLHVVSFVARRTKAGKRMANVVFSDEYKNLTPALVFPANFMSCYGKLSEGKAVKVALKETSDGALFVDKVLL